MKNIETCLHLFEEVDGDQDHLHQEVIVMIDHQDVVLEKVDEGGQMIGGKVEVIMIEVHRQDMMTAGEEEVDTMIVVEVEDMDEIEIEIVEDGNVGCLHWL